MAFSDSKDIWKKFDLPERQTKINSLLKKTYCICRSTDGGGFMIQCDICHEWFHENCVAISEEEASFIKFYVCPLCAKKHPNKHTLRDEMPSQPSMVPSPSKKKEKELKAKPKASSSKPKPSTKAGAGRPTRKYERRVSRDAWKPESCTKCSMKITCGKCRICKNPEKSKKDGCLKRECFCHLSKSDRDSRTQQGSGDEWEPAPNIKKKAGRRPLTAKRAYNKRAKATKAAGWTDSDSEGAERWVENVPKQCLGLECINQASPGKKYCSVECGVKLATERIYHVLPSRVKEWLLTPCISDENNVKALEEVNKKQKFSNERIIALEQKRYELDQHIATMKAIRLSPDHQNDDSDEEGKMDDGQVCCVTCGHEVAMKNCLKHFERCFNKFESQMSFGAAYKTNLEGSPIFCDFFNPLNKTYCKRLKVLCPEHLKEPKVEIDEICGAPLIKEFKVSLKEYCRMRKRDCNRHYGWEKLHRAEIDLERVRHWLKLDELAETERQLKLALDSRRTVMGLMLHSTFDHDKREAMEEEEEEEEEEEAPETPKSDPSLESNEEMQVDTNEESP